MEIDSNAKREDVEIIVRTLMEEEKGKIMKENAMEWKKKAEEAAQPYGTSYLNFEKLVKEVLFP